MLVSCAIKFMNCMQAGTEFVFSLSKKVYIREDLFILSVCDDPFLSIKLQYLEDSPDYKYLVENLFSEKNCVSLLFPSRSLDSE